MRTRGLILLSTLPLLSALVCCGSTAAAGQTGNGDAPGPARTAGEANPVNPRLIVLMVIDQLRADLLDRYDSAFTGGLRRLLDEGRVFENTTHDHALTETSPGHASIATGTYPSRHGMVSNQWRQMVGGFDRLVSNVIHEDYVEVGDTLFGAGAPDRLERSGFADWLADQYGDSRILSLSAKDRSAVLLGGKGARPVFWFSSFQGRFVTSTYYADDVPGWVDDFNESTLRRHLVEDSIWVSTVPPEWARLSRPDTAALESASAQSWFPHVRPALDPENPPYPGEWLEVIPQLDGATLQLARIGLRELDMGQDDVPDLLAIGLSQTDRVGHGYGPFSREQLDNLLRLDRELGAFLEFLDQEVGVDGYVLALSADHGVLEMPEYRVEQGLEGRRLTTEDRVALEELLGEVIRATGTTDISEAAPAVASAITVLDWVEDAWTLDELAHGEATDSIAILFQHSAYPGRRPGALGRFGVLMRLSEGTLDWGRPRGSTHGSAYYYDRHVPLIFLGPGIEAGRSETKVATIDIAPTLARLTGIKAPEDLDGTVIRDPGIPLPTDPRRDDTDALRERR